ncbi:NAD-dependent epimerase/dehydratase family protein [Nocardioides aurantiacus]|uniref:Nucleoside-diphosphate-sugar epimerase n=1 Tax=Nocardioides aurantiacus TaxID=86796 RepID=A0A3N2CZB1_9ACTN|nr:NAD-dependent epimerase/dehydratase family protein [Nocardioides aurantiacus]ROR92738.1 nucleoside-diphosphate-sugar epimerase [Nocardioides aurantiacus]
MKLLVLGGTLFLSRAVAAEAAARGHEVTCAARGHSGGVPEGATLVTLDRAEPDWSALQGDWDAVVDVAGSPGWVRDALDHLADRVPHWVFVSTISVYADHATLHGTPATLPLLDPVGDAVEQDTPEAYGGAKVACEQLVRQRATTSLVVRPGLIVGPGDPTGRFSYWPERLAEGGDVLAPDHPERDVQLIDVRDLATFLVDGAEQRREGVLDATGRVTGLGEVLEEVQRGVEGHGPGSRATLYWAAPAFLRRHHVQPWSGPRSLPLWLPEAMSGMLTHDVSEAFAAGLRTRPISETAADTLTWLRSEQGRVTVTGMTRAEEQELLDDWHTIE